jgi:hypothetical protein
LEYTIIRKRNQFKTKTNKKKRKENIRNELKQTNEEHGESVH